MLLNNSTLKLSLSYFYVFKGDGSLSLRYVGEVQMLGLKFKKAGRKQANCYEKWFFFFFLGAQSHYVAQAVLEFTT